MNNSYNNRLKKNKKMPQENSLQKTKGLFPLGNYINNGKKLNSYSGYNKLEIKNKVLNENSNPIVNTYNPPDSYYQNYKNNNVVNFNNHSLFDSNKQKVIKPRNDNNYVEFISNKNSINVNNNKLPLCTLRNYQLSINRLKYIDGNCKNENYGESRKPKVNYNINHNTRNNTFHKNYYTKISQTNFNYNMNNLSKNNNKNIKANKSLNISKNKNSAYFKNYSSKHRNKNNNLSNNFTEKKNNCNCICTPTPSQSKDKIQGKKYFKRNKTDNKNLTENNSQDKKTKKFINTNIKYNINKRNNNNKINNDTHSPSINRIKNYNSPDNLNKKKRHIIKDNNIINKTDKNIKEDNLKSIMPIKLNIEYTTKEKLSRLKRIIEQSSTNHKFYQIELPKNIQNKNIKTEENNKKSIFKKKKIEILNKENNEDKEEKINNKYYENNFLVTSPINIKNKFKKIINNNNIKDNNQIQSMVASYNLYIQKENYINQMKKNIENKISTKETEQTSYLYTNKDKTFKKNKAYKKKNIESNNNIEDTISLSYSKERNLSISSREQNNEDISISLPFLIENFNVQYNKYNKILIIDEKNKIDYNNKKNNINNDSEDDDYQLTKEIILLKKGLSKKNELNNAIKKKLKEIIPERNYKLTLFGNKNVYKKKTRSYKNYKL